MGARWELIGTPIGLFSIAGRTFDDLRQNMRVDMLEMVTGGCIYRKLSFPCVPAVLILCMYLRMTSCIISDAHLTRKVASHLVDRQPKGGP